MPSRKRASNSDAANSLAVATPFADRVSTSNGSPSSASGLATVSSTSALPLCGWISAAMVLLGLFTTSFCTFPSGVNVAVASNSGSVTPGTAIRTPVARTRSSPSAVLLPRPKSTPARPPASSVTPSRSSDFSCGFPLIAETKSGCALATAILTLPSAPTVTFSSRIEGEGRIEMFPDRIFTGRPSWVDASRSYCAMSSGMKNCR